MEPAQEFNESNLIMNAPASMPECKDLLVWKGNQQDGTPVIISKWTPNEKELDALNNGESIYLYIVGQTMPPVSLCAVNPFYYLDNTPEIYKENKTN